MKRRRLSAASCGGKPVLDDARVDEWFRFIAERHRVCVVCVRVCAFP
jgi:hypothetical protein